MTASSAIGIYFGSIRLHFSSNSLQIISIDDGSIPFAGLTGLPFSSSTPTKI